MERLRRKFFPSKKSVKSTTSSKLNRFDILYNLFLIDSSKKHDDDDEIYLEPEYDDTSNIAMRFDAIAEELLTIAKKSVKRTKCHMNFYLSSPHRSWLEVWGINFFSSCPVDFFPSSSGKSDLVLRIFIRDQHFKIIKGELKFYNIVRLPASEEVEAMLLVKSCGFGLEVLVIVGPGFISRFNLRLNICLGIRNCVPVDDL
jgi:hypothetical protein